MQILIAAQPITARLKIMIQDNKYNLIPDMRFTKVRKERTLIK